MSSLIILNNPVAIQADVIFPLKANDTTDKSINRHSRTTSNISTNTGIHGESDGSFHFSNSSYLRSSIFNTLYANFKTDPFTLCFWIYPTYKFYTNSNMNIIGGWNNSYYSGLWLGYLTNTLNLYLRYYDGSTYLNPFPTLSQTLSFNTWYFVSIRMSDSFLSIGIDDNIVELTDATPDIATVSGTAGIGGACGPTATNSGFHYNGRVMGVQAFPKILSVGELKIIRNQKGNLTF